jgi:predicted small secreted protein
MGDAASPRKRRKLGFEHGRSASEANMRKVVILVAAAAALFTSACNTVEGVGRDVQAAGRAVTDTARDAKN